MKRVRTQKPRNRRGRSWPEILPADPRDPDVVRAKALAYAQRVARSRRMRELASRVIEIVDGRAASDAAAGARR